MKQLRFAFIIVCFSLFSLATAKEKFALFCFLNHDFTTIKYDRTANVFVNGKALNKNGYKVKIEINYPDFDTVKVINGYDGVTRTIITRFKEDHCYEFSRYDSKYDFEFFDANDVGIYKRKLALIPEKETGHRKKLTDLIDSIQVNKEIGRVFFKVINYSDSIAVAGICGGVFIDFTSGIVLKNNSGIITEDKMIDVMGCLFKIKMGQGKIRNENDIYGDYRHVNFQYSEKEVFVLYDEWFGFEYKFFTKENLEVTYNYKTKKVSIKIK